jgi:hypothetical protein
MAPVRREQRDRRREWQGSCILRRWERNGVATDPAQTQTRMKDWLESANGQSYVHYSRRGPAGPRRPAPRYVRGPPFPRRDPTANHHEGELFRARRGEAVRARAPCRINFPPPPLTYPPPTPPPPPRAPVTSNQRYPGRIGTGSPAAPGQTRRRSGRLQETPEMRYASRAACKPSPSRLCRSVSPLPPAP